VPWGVQGMIPGASRGCLAGVVRGRRCTAGWVRTRRAGNTPSAARAAGWGGLCAPPGTHGGTGPGRSERCKGSTRASMMGSGLACGTGVSLALGARQYMGWGSALPCRCGSAARTVTSQRGWNSAVKPYCRILLHGWPYSVAWMAGSPSRLHPPRGCQSLCETGPRNTRAGRDSAARLGPAPSRPGETVYRQRLRKSQGVTQGVRSPYSGAAGPADHGPRA
jgi:hypothetical protein